MVRAVPVTHQPAPSAQCWPAGETTDAARAAERDSTRDLRMGRRSAVSSSAAARLSVRPTCALFMTKRSAAVSDGTGDCIAIVGISDFLDSTMTAFTSQFGLAGDQLSRVSCMAANPGINSAGESEAELDLQWAHATAPGASIVYHLGSNLVSDISGAVTRQRMRRNQHQLRFLRPNSSFIENTLDPHLHAGGCAGAKRLRLFGRPGRGGPQQRHVARSAAPNGQRDVGRSQCDFGGWNPIHADLSPAETTSVT